MYVNYYYTASCMQAQSNVQNVSGGLSSGTADTMKNVCVLCIHLKNSVCVSDAVFNFGIFYLFAAAALICSFKWLNILNQSPPELLHRASCDVSILWECSFIVSVLAGCCRVR